jgi:hypothetical protein
VDPAHQQTTGFGYKIPTTSQLTQVGQPHSGTVHRVTVWYSGTAAQYTESQCGTAAQNLQITVCLYQLTIALTVQ